MSEQEKEIGLRLAEEYNALPETEQARLVGFAEGVAAMTPRQEPEVEEQTA